MSRSKRAMVMEIGSRWLVVLQPNGSFRQLPLRPGLQVGDMVDLPLSAYGRYFGVLAASVLVVVLVYASAVFLPANRAYAYVSVDGVPGVELAVNSRGTVVSGNAVSAEGEALLAGVRLTQRSLTDAVQQLLSKARQQTALTVDSEVVLVTVTPVREQLDAELLRQMNDQAAAGVQAALRDQTTTPQVEQLVVSQQLQAEARALGLTPGQYAIALKASEAGLDIDLDQLAGKNVAQALHDQGISPGQIISQLQQDEDLDRLMEQNRDKLHGKTKKEQREPEQTATEQTKTEPENTRGEQGLGQGKDKAPGQDGSDDRRGKQSDADKDKGKDKGKEHDKGKGKDK